MIKLLVFLKGSSIHRTAFLSLSSLYPSIELSTNSLEDVNQGLLPLFNLISDIDSFEHLHIVGLGDYSGRNNNFIPNCFKLKNTGMGNNFCNLFSYKLNKYIPELPQDLKTKIYFDFLHVPSKFHTTDDIAQILGGTNTHLLY